MQIQKTKRFIVKKEIDKLMDAGMTDNRQIYTRIVKDLGIPRPTVRRIAREMKLELEKKVKILYGDEVGKYRIGF
jgi:transcription initiation factor TFIIIB Brf1 subunit/transcription initiation factor TFIIB